MKIPSRPFIGLLAVSFLVLTPLAMCGDEPRYTFILSKRLEYPDRKTPQLEQGNFVVCTPTADLTAGYLEEQDLWIVADYLEMCHETFAQMGFRPPGGRRPGPLGKQRTLVVLYRWDRSARWLGKDIRDAYAMHTEGVIHLRTEFFGAQGRMEDKRNTLQARRVKLQAIAHELFHAIQLAYEPPNYDYEVGLWFKEATATWAMRAAFPDNLTREDMSIERSFLRYSYLPLQAQDRDLFKVTPTHRRFASGHPYGTAALFQYLAHHHGGTKFVEKLLLALEQDDGCKALARHPLAPIATALGIDDPEDARIRQILADFAVASALGSDAPAGKRFPKPKLYGKSWPLDTSLLVDPEGRLVSWVKHCTTANDPSKPSLRLLAGSDRDVIWLASDSHQGLAGQSREVCWIGSAGMRVYRVVRPPNASENSRLFVTVESAKDELTVLGLATRDGSTNVKMIPAQYDDEQNCYRLQVDDFNQLSNVKVVVVRHSAQPIYKSYPVSLAMADPPTVKSVKLRQGSKTVYAIEFVPVTNRHGQVTKRKLKTSSVQLPQFGAGPAGLEIEFTRAVKPIPGQPACQWRDQPIQMTNQRDGVVWAGTIPENLLEQHRSDSVLLSILFEHIMPQSGMRLPLDSDPTTIAVPVVDNWEGYERGYAISHQKAWQGPEKTLPVNEEKPRLASWGAMIGGSAEDKSIPGTHIEFLGARIPPYLLASLTLVTSKDNPKLNPASPEFDPEAAPQELTVFEKDRRYVLGSIPEQSPAKAFNSRTTIEQYADAQTAAATFDQWKSQLADDIRVDKHPGSQLEYFRWAGAIDTRVIDDRAWVQCTLRVLADRWIFEQVHLAPDTPYMESLSSNWMMLGGWRGEAEVFDGGLLDRARLFELFPVDISGRWKSGYGTLPGMFNINQTGTGEVSGEFIAENGNKYTLEGSYDGFNGWLMWRQGEQQGRLDLHVYIDRATGAWYPADGSEGIYLSLKRESEQD